ncbi:heme biosynthesis protein HemY [Aminobacter aganoensis]|uniref:HemY protein n=1 Tax=Aminobacter aganoensis TaxID=83264 RepID=A0A7X0F9R5_9HYPH|nr:MULTISPECIES: heme biosynthesis protein HemY [Aminobacter]KQU73143.1 heme biosynthesis protein HemY [Aminobacter sp. DSM 101952]MBB6355600.1 HemY protein [Aminobacter aganoensis]
MIRILFFLAIVFALGLGFAWLADRPGDMVVTFGGYQYQVSLMVAAVAVTAIVAAVMLLWWLTKSLWNSPYAIARHFRARRRDRGYQALSTGMIAAGAGDAALARKKNKEAAKLIRSDQEPLIQLLDAQAALLEGDHDGARQKFEAMLDDPEMRLLGLRGLYLEAERLGDRSAARHYAGRAAGLAPQLSWAADSTLEEKAERGDWDGALALVDAQKSTRQIERDVANNRRSVLLTAKAMQLFDSDFNAARTAALEANRLRPEFGPAAIAAAKALFRQNDVRKGSKALEGAWKAEPLPDVAELYVHGRPGDAVLDRLARAKKLQSLRQNHPESSLAVARAALEAQDYALARAEAEAAARMQPREGAYLLLADIEEAETGNQGKVRQWLAKAVRAPRDPAWVADGVVSERWAPFSPVTGRLDAFEWKAPEERLGHLIEQHDEEPEERVAIPAIRAAQPAGDDIVEVESDVEAMPEKEAEPAVAKVVPPALDGVAGVVDEDKAEPIRLPDDPGVDPEVERDNAQRRFRLF